MTISQLKDLKCQACSGETPKLSLEQINNNLKQLVDWEVNEGITIYEGAEDLCNNDTADHGCWVDVTISKVSESGDSEHVLGQAQDIYADARS